MNESFNGTAWKICPTTSFCGPATVETSVNMTVCLINHGAQTIVAVMEAMYCDVGSFTRGVLNAVDSNRLYHSARKSEAAGKKARMRRREIRKGLVDADTEREGVVYSAGGC